MKLIKFLQNERDRQLEKREKQELMKSDASVSPYNSVLADIEEIKKNYDPKDGFFARWRQRVQNDNRLNNLIAFNAEQSQYFERARIMEVAVNEGKMREAELYNFLATQKVYFLRLKNEATMLEKASKKGLALGDYYELKKEKFLSKRRMKEAQELSDIKVQEHARMTEIDLNTKIRNAEETARIGYQNKVLSEHQKIIQIQGFVNDCYKLIYEIKNSGLPDDLQARMLEDQEKTIEAFKVDLDARQSRLAQAGNGKKV